MQPTTTAVLFSFILGAVLVLAAPIAEANVDEARGLTLPIFIPPLPTLKPTLTFTKPLLITHIFTLNPISLVLLILVLPSLTVDVISWLTTL
ncbi:hypothetical protein BDQ12DRAFT_724150 [Crucibulum laeve]|uniref:Uncharacterized protein n=1 Tax=Crucibulum laeve TaxID=68775 RepID=A0A5C3LX42_9AGAR|nr:hypothetical protein BDQ12DRAFT_724150 [Crucibulum laeve]